MQAKHKASELLVEQICAAAESGMHLNTVANDVLINCRNL